MSEKPTITEVNIADLQPDPKNANRGTSRGRKLLNSSLKRLGAGRSVLLDKNNATIGGNKTIEAAQAQGYKKVLIVDSDGDTLIAVRRKDLDITKDKKAKELALADNRIAELDLDWDPGELAGLEDLTKDYFDEDELKLIVSGEEADAERRTDTIDTQPPPKKIWVLIGVDFSRFDLIQEPLAALEKIADISVQSARNE